MKDCELCGSKARMHCESDHASLCWDCDSKVHGANFLVAKHSRSLLCHVCHSPTPWKASGPKLTPTVSVCEACVGLHGRRRSDLTDDESDDEDQEEEEEEENGENQVVPWSFSSSPPPSLDGASSSSEDPIKFSGSKRSMDADLDSDDEETTSFGSFRSAKRSRVSEVNRRRRSALSSSS